MKARKIKNSQSLISINCLVLLLFLLFAKGILTAQEDLPFNRQLRHTIEEIFLDDGQVSLAKINRYRLMVRKRYQEVRLNLLNFYLKKEKQSLAEATVRADNKNEIKAFRILLAYIDDLEELEGSLNEFMKLALKVLELDYALKVTGTKLYSTIQLERIYYFLQKWKIPSKAAPEGEAYNLVNPENGKFFSQIELIKLKKRGVDISRFNPPESSSFWVDRPISTTDVREYYQKGKYPLYKGLNICFPEKKANYKNLIKTQAKPFMHIYVLQEGMPKEFNLMMAPEIHSEVTCAALFSTLGFSVDLCKYVRDFKVVLGQMTYTQFKKEWESYYSGFTLEDYIKEKGSDEDGNYIKFHEVVLEAKPDELIRVGPWPFSENGHKGLREVRGSVIFSIWVANLDLQESASNKLVLRKHGDRYESFHIQHDLGFAFGSSWVERPGSFSWKLVKKKTKNNIYLQYYSFQGRKKFKHVTYADAKWMVRLIARLTREQITEAIRLGGWPQSLERFLIEKLISRRNQLVNAFNLLGEVTPEGNIIKPIEFKRYVTTSDQAVVKGKLKTYRFPGYPQYFGPRLSEVASIVLKGMRNMAIDSIVKLTGSIKYIELKPHLFGWDEGIITKIIIRLNREVESNPLPKNESDTFLVKDSLEIGLRLGYGFTFSGDLAYIKKYTLVYPVANRDAGRFHGNFILNLLLPFQSRDKNMPRNHVVMIEDYLEGRGRIGSRYPHDFIFDGILTFSRVYLHRHFLSFKNSKLIFWEDISFYNQLSLRLYFELLEIFRFPFVDTYTQKGRLNRDYIEMDIVDLEDNPTKQEAIQHLLEKDNPVLLKKLGHHKLIQDEFLEKKFLFNLIGMYQKRSIYRIDLLKQRTTPKINPGDANDFTHHYQVESRKLKSWNFVDNGERHFSSVKFIGKAINHKTVQNQLLTISMQINDKSTYDGELKRGYLRFLNSVALKKSFMNFNPSAHTTNQLWGSTQILVNIFLYKEAIDNLIASSEQQIWEALAQVTGKPVEFWHKKASWRSYWSRTSSAKEYLALSMAVRTRSLIKMLKKVRETKDPFKRMNRIVKAVRKTIYMSGHTFCPYHLALIHKIAGTDNIYMNSMVTVPLNRENILPAGFPFFNEIGVDRGLTLPYFQFNFDDPSEIYHLF
jgi:hypothetical protein